MRSTPARVVDGVVQLPEIPTAAPGAPPVQPQRLMLAVDRWVLWHDGDQVPADAAEAESKLPAEIRTRLTAERAKVTG